jgi:hypothetical protein
VLPASQVHEVKLIHQAVFLQHGQGSIDSDLIQSGILAPGTFPKSNSIEMAFGPLDYLDQKTTLMGHSQAARN